MSDQFIYGISILASILFMGCYLPDLIEHIRSKEITGVSIKSSLLLIIALSLAVITNWHFGNYAFVVNDVVCIILNACLLRLRIIKLKRR